jgi:antitoxin component of MazEF toxin-antitoxin module
MREEEKKLEEIIITKPVRANGSSFSITISPSEMKALGLEIGDMVRAVIRRA